MSYDFTSFNGELNLCYLFLQEYKKCSRNKMYPKTNCVHEEEDFI